MGRVVDAGHREAEARYRSLFELMPDGVIIVDPLTAQIVEFNDAACQQLGYTREEFRRLSIADFEVNETPDEIAARVRSVMELGRVDFRTRHRQKSGEVREVYVTLQPVQLGGRMVLHALLRDLTDSVRAHAALRGSEQRYRVTFETAPVGLTELALSGHFLRVNPAFCAMLGYAPEEVLGRAFDEITVPDDLPRNQELFRRLVTSEVDEIRFEKRYLRKDGSHLWTEVSTVAVRGVRDLPLYLVSVVQDISERKRAAETQARLAAALEATAEAVLLLDPDGRIHYVNRAFEAMTGHTRAAAEGHTPTDLLRHGDADLAPLDEMCAAVRATGLWRGILTNFRADGTPFTARAAVAAVRDNDGRIIEYVETMQDVTAELDLQQRLARSQTFEAAGKLAAGMAHSFNNILTAMTSFVNMVHGDHPAGDPRAEALSAVHDAAARGSRLIRQLLAYSRRQAGPLRRLELNHVLLGIAPLLRGAVGEEVTVELDLAPDLRPVLADPALLETAVVNLAVNARDAMPGGGCLRLTTGNLNDEAVLLIVEDTGGGIAPEHVDRIFEPYFSTKPESQGSGMGLAMVYSTVEQIGGAITVHSTPGDGARFEITFPACARADRPADRERAQGAGKTVLVVQPEAAERAALGDTLSGHGYQVLSAANLDGALAAIDAHGYPVDLLLTEVVLPGMTGARLARDLATRYGELKVLFTAGQDHSGSFRPPQGPLLVRPVSPEVLLATTRAALDA